MNIEEYERIIPNMECEGLTFITPNQHCAWRVSSTLTKEPDTIAWVRTMESEDVLFDIGANIGQYSMLAAKRGAFVHAFEPEAQNFSVLVRNIAINNLSERVIPWPVALNDHVSMEILHLATLTAGGSCHSYGESVNYNGEKKQFPYKQGSIATTLDHFIARYGLPTYIKIDVDGFEHLVLRGISDASLSRVKSVLIETNTHYPEHSEMSLRMEKLGFSFDPSQADAARRKEGPFQGIGNVIWWKE